MTYASLEKSGPAEGFSVSFDWAKRNEVLPSRNTAAKQILNAMDEGCREQRRTPKCTFVPSEVLRFFEATSYPTPNQFRKLSTTFFTSPLHFLSSLCYKQCTERVWLAGRIICISRARPASKFERD